MAKAKSTTRKTTKKRHAKKAAPQKPNVLLAAIAKAVLPYVNAEGEDLKANASWFDVYRVLLPILADYTVADAANLLPLLRAKVNSHPNTPQGRRYGEAFCDALWLLEDFVATGRSSGLDCVRARAAVLSAAMTDDGVLSDWGNIRAAYALEHDIECIAANRFEADLFGGSKGKPAAWLLAVLNEREKLSATTVRKMHAQAFG